MKIRENVPISELTTMRLGGEARFVVEIATKWEIPTVIDWAENGGVLSCENEDGEQKTITNESRLPWFVLGGGANTLGRDEGFPGVIILTQSKGIDIVDSTSDDFMVFSEAGENWDDFVRFTVGHDLSGIECLAKIPGTVGAAPVQNIGAYGQEISQVIDHVEAYDTVKGEFVIIGLGEMEMSYRETLFNTGKEAGRYIITGVAVVLSDEYLKPPFYNSLQKYLEETLSDEEKADYDKNGYPPEILYAGVAAIRGEKLPDPAEKASAGSFFRNIYFEASDAETLALAEASGCKIYDKPDGRKMINTGALIEKAGLKGELLHGMRISDKAALVLINESAKSYAELAAARTEIIERVREKFGFEIRQEPVEILA